MTKLILALLLMVCTLTLAAQNISADTLVWPVTSFTVHPSDSVVNRTSQFETRPGLVKWIQKGGSFVYEFSVTGSTGSWENVSQSGERVLTVTFRGYTGIIRFARTASGILIEPDIRKDGVNLFPFTFQCSTITTAGQ